MNELTTYRWSFEEDVLEYRKAGFQAIGVWRRKLADYGEERGIELLQDCNLRVSNLLWAGGFTGNDGRSHAEAIDDAREALELAARLEAECLVLYPGGSDLHIQKHCHRLLQAALDALLPIAEELDVTLAIEPMHPAAAREWTFLTDLQATLDVIQRHGSQHLGLVLDLYHFGDAPKLMELIPVLVRHVAVVHVGDRREPPSIDQSRSPLGRGYLPLDTIIRALLDHGYDGSFDVELLGPEIEASAYPLLLEAALQTMQQHAAAAGTLESF